MSRTFPSSSAGLSLDAVISWWLYACTDDSISSAYGWNGEEHILTPTPT